MMKYKRMLAHPVGDYSRIKSKDWPLYVQPKLDGVRCLIQTEYDPVYKAGVIKAYSRTGKEWKNIDHILKELIPFFGEYPNIVLDGELYNHKLKNDFEKIISLVRKTKPTDDDRFESYEKVQFHCYDIIFGTDIPERPSSFHDFKYRNLFIKENLDNRFASIKILPYGVVHNTEEIEVQHDLQKAAGYEGSILRKNENYECKRSWTLMKIKDFSDAEALIVGYEEGKGKRIGTLGKFVMQDEDGNQFGCPPGKGYNYKDLTDILNNVHDYIGQVATFTYFERTKANSYRHPHYKALRNYE